MLVKKLSPNLKIATVLLLLVVSAVNAQKSTISNFKQQQLWFNAPANQWLEALPLGNGSLGAMIFGSTDVERIQFNESSLCTGTTETVGNYQPFGDVYFNWQHKNVTNYRRSLNLNNSIHTITYSANGINYKHEYFISYPDKAMVMQISSNKRKSISTIVGLNDARKNSIRLDKNMLSFKGMLENKLEYEAILFIKNTGGDIINNDSTINVSNADTLTCYLVAGTSFIPFARQNYLGISPHEKLIKQLQSVTLKPFSQVKKTHQNDVAELFNRVSFSLGDTKDSIPTDERFRSYSSDHKDLNFEALVFQYGRYLLIASSRKGGLPANLQGIWNNEFKPAWYSQYTTNINVQMNYWLAEQTNLSECHLPLFDWVDNLAAVNKLSQDSLLKVNHGWVAYSTNNIMGGPSKWRLHRPGSAWLSQHFWEHYAFTGNLKFLRERAYPILKDVVGFWENHLVENKEGKLITPDGWSPEHGPFKNEQDKMPYPGASYDQQIVYDLFTNYIEASTVLKIDTNYRKKVELMRMKLLGPQIGKWGQLQEWMEDWDDSTDHHRHNSHMFAVHPGRQINPILTPGLAKAASISLNSRGNISSGWSTAWRMNISARLFNGNKAHDLIKSLLFPANSNLKYGEKSGLYMNLFDAHPPFQIDGNFGYTSGVTEMLMQSQNNCIHILPALPDDWKSGSISGIKARGNITVGIDWEKGILKKCTIVPEFTGWYCIRYKNSEKKVKLVAGQLYRFDANYFIHKSLNL